MLPAINLEAGHLDIKREVEVRTLSLSDVVEGKVPSASYLASNELPLSLVTIDESGAVPISIPSIRNRQRLRSQRQLTANLSLSNLTLTDTIGDRLQYSYRLISTLARMTGHLVGTGLLMTSLREVEGVDPFYYPQQSSPKAGMTQGLAGAAKSFEALNNLPYAVSLPSQTGRLEDYYGLTFLPPPIPNKYYPSSLNPHDIHKYRQQRIAPPGYSPADDEGLCLWLDGMEAVAYYLGLHLGAPSAPEKGVFGLIGMLTAETARLVWPCRDDILNYEQQLLFYIGDLITHRTSATESAREQTPEKILIEEMGMNRTEAIMMCKAAGLFMHYVYSDDPDTLRARELQRLETIGDRCIDAGDPRAELATAKHKHQLMGLTKSDGEDGLMELRDLASKALAEPDE